MPNIYSAVVISKFRSSRPGGNIKMKVLENFQENIRDEAQG